MIDKISQSDDSSEIKRDVLATRVSAAKNLDELFIIGLSNIYWVEIYLVKAVKTMCKNATNAELIEVLLNHLTIVEDNILRLDQVLKIINKKVNSSKSLAVEALISEDYILLEKTELGVMRDIAIISTYQKMAHYKIASYGILHKIAATLNYNSISRILHKNLVAEQNVDQVLSTIANNEFDL